MQSLETPRLILRRFVPADAAAMFRIYQDPEVMRFMGRGPASVADEARHLEAQNTQRYPQGLGLLAIIEKSSRRLLGYCGLLQQALAGRTELELSYLLAREAWGLGFASEAACCLAGAWPSLRPEPRLVALVHPENTASARVAARAGFHREGLVEFKSFGTVELHTRYRDRARSCLAGHPPTPSLH
jgi:ribosomal-protein-alanine N-acetyltransferase